MTTDTALDKLNHVLQDLESVIDFVDDAFGPLCGPLKDAKDNVESVRDALAESQSTKAS